MKKLFTLFLLGCAAATANAQYQVQNGGFEEWESVSYNNKSGEEPLHWSSFLTGTGGLKSMAANDQVEKSTDIRSSSSGTYSAKITRKNVLGIATAQGNLTTGCINMGSMDAKNPGTSATENIANRGKATLFGGSPEGNYNYTDTENDNFNQKFTGLPDAMHVWVKFQGGTEKSPYAKASTLLHTDGYYQDPLPKTNDCSGQLVAAATNLEIASSDNWQELTIPFVYSITDGTRPAYALVSFSTNATPGQGTGSDVMLIDDLEYLYYSELKTLTYNGENIFKEGTIGYDLSNEAYDESKLSCTSNGHAATIEKVYKEDTGILTLTVKGDDWSEENKNEHVYTIQFKTPEVEHYTNSLLVNVFGSYLTPSEKTVDVIHNVDGSYSFSLKDLELTGLGRIGDIVVNDLDVTENGETTNYSKENAMVYVELLQAEVPVTLQATETNGNLTASINIPLAPGSMEVNVTFAPALNVNSETTLAGTTGLYNITYTHTFPAGWSTVCLPFSTTQSEATLNAGQVQEFTAFADNTLTFNKLDINKSLTANTPYLVYYENETEVTLYGSSEDFTPAAVTFGDVTFTGNYTAGKDMEGLYGVADQEGKQYIMKGGAGSTLGSTGAYFTVSGTTAGVNTLSLDIEGEGTTGIESIVAEEGQAFDVYTLTGVKVRTAATDLDGLQRGIYIVNGKKVLVK